jgi:hypothetical protein
LSPTVSGIAAARRRFKKYAESIGFQPSTESGAFYRLADEPFIIHSFDVQRNKYPEEANFAVNVGISDLDAQRKFGSSLGPEAASPSTALVQDRPARLQVGGCDRWYDLTEAGIGQALVDLERWGLPVLEAIRTRKDLADRPEGPLSPTPMQRAVLYKLLGDDISFRYWAHEALKEVDDRPGIRSWRETFLNG